MATDPATEAAAQAIRSARIARYSEAVRSAPNYDRAKHEPEIAEQERIGREWSWEGDLRVAEAVVAVLAPLIRRQAFHEAAEKLEAVDPLSVIGYTSVDFLPWSAALVRGLGEKENAPHGSDDGSCT